MFTRTFATFALVLVFSLQVQAHATVSPVLGVSGTPIRADAKRPNNNNVCGRGVDIAGSVDTSTPVQAAADGTFTMTATNFNRRLDGSRQFTAKVDATATGDSMTGKVTMVQNGDRAPPELGSQQVVAQLPAGTQCTGGQAGNLCLVQFKSASGFGNCVVVQQGNAATGTNTTDTTGNDSSSAATGTNTTDTSGNDSSNAVSTGSTDASATATDTSGVDSSDALSTDSTGVSATATAVPTTAATGGKKKGFLSGLFQKRNLAGSLAARSVIQAFDLLDSREFDDEEIIDLVGRDLWDLLMELE
jgi:hypothetical protein